MKLPNRKNAIIPEGKLTHYLLSLTHEKGKSKAKFFRGIGFNDTNIEKLEMALLKIGKTGSVIKVDSTKSNFTIKYVIYGFIDSPNGKRYKIKTVWGVKIETKIPRFITAIPGV